MTTTKWTLLWLFTIFGSGFVDSPENDAHVVYDSLDTLAEIMITVEANAASQAPPAKVVEGAIDGLLSQLDPHSNFYNAKRYRTLREDQAGSFYGIGIMVGYQNKQLTVISPLEGTPAAAAGIQAGDVIRKIDTQKTADMDLYDAIRLLRGAEGSRVRITLSRPRLEKEVEVEVFRAEIPSNNVRASFMLDEKTGYVALKDFGESAAAEVESAILQLQSAGMAQLVLDLRGNPGGLLPQAIAVSSLFVPGEKLVVSTEGRLTSANQKYFSEKSSIVKQTPLVVLIDRGSASASEIVAGAIQDHDRGLIIGVNSWGKGLVQSVFPIADGKKGLALTTARYFTPSGRNIQGSFESLEAYYNPKSSQKDYFEEGEPSQFRTVHGRTVVEVRGITPDVYLAFKETPSEVDALTDDHNAFFNFATTRPELYENPAIDWEADDALIDDFFTYLQQEKIPHDEAAKHRTEIQRKLTHQVLYIKDGKLAWRYLMKHDRHTRSALELFPKAEKLFQVYLGNEALDSEYTHSLKNYAKLKLSKEKETTKSLRP
ncbi:S41 family peptidase [Acanthopleuribacter pedis]|uniref:S41 family peptidase n=1 Tax=Acanthopleuribacter pedis TaxID=442870 RepID=A0A8J7Q695_9BACT|nr:S41 family peptidase [Acanthopleuribacter pedis]MBO1318856.1 S41 family peptidase [Acanthopleuribacter pedis]